MDSCGQAIFYSRAFLALGIGGEGGVLQGIDPSWPWRIVLGVAGALLYLLVAREAARLLGRLLGGTESRRKDACAIAWTAYFTGGIVSVLIGLLNPVGIFIVIASAAASSLGGASGLLWLTFLIPPSEVEGALSVPRSWIWIVMGMAATAAYALVLGQSIVLAH
jgi:hypothetical protein